MAKTFNSLAGRIALGTAQFGLDYGISNKNGQVRPETIADILSHAATCGVDTIDTAAGYGCSEEALGAALSRTDDPFNIVTKFLPDMGPDGFDGCLQGSLKRLRTDSIHTYLAHRSRSFKDQDVLKAASKAKERGLIQKFGVSVYSPSELEWMMEEDMPFEVVQIPFSIFDQRFKPLLPKLKDRGVEIHVRSVFLQGLFFLAASELNESFNSVKDKVEKIQELSLKEDIPLSALLLNYATLHGEIDKIVIGVTSKHELEENLKACEYIERCRPLVEILNEFVCTDERIIVPSNWEVSA